MPKRESCGSLLRGRLPPFDPLLGFPACTHARRLGLPLRPRSRASVTCNLHSARCPARAKLPATSCLGAFWTPAARAGGISSLPASKKPAQIQTHALQTQRATPFSWSHRRDTLSIAIVTLKNRTLSPVVERFLICVREVAASFGGKQAGRAAPPRREGQMVLSPLWVIRARSSFAASPMLLPDPTARQVPGFHHSTRSAET